MFENYVVFRKIAPEFVDIRKELIARAYNLLRMDKEGFTPPGAKEQSITRIAKWNCHRAAYEGLPLGVAAFDTVNELYAFNAEVDSEYYDEKDVLVGFILTNAFERYESIN